MLYELKQENERLEHDNIDMINQLGKITSRIYKAIELLNKRKNEVEDLYVEMKSKDYFEECDEIINILQNGDNSNE